MDGGRMLWPTLDALDRAPRLTSQQLAAEQRFSSSVGPINQSTNHAREYRRQQTLSRIGFAQSWPFSHVAALTTRAFGFSHEESIALGAEIGGTMMLSAPSNGLGPSRPVHRAPIQTLKGLSAPGEIPVVRPPTVRVDVPNKGLLVQSGDGVALDMFGRNISPRTQSILDRFGDARRVLVEDASGKQSVVHIVDNLGRREVKVSDLGRLQAATGNEFSLLRGPEGQRVLMQGDPTQMMIPEQYVGNGWKWSGHSHPYGIDPSSSDRFVLRAFQQEQSMIKSAADGRQGVFTQFEDWSEWKPTVVIR
jgi:hypothetical protein